MFFLEYNNGNVIKNNDNNISNNILIIHFNVLKIIILKRNNLKTDLYFFVLYTQVYTHTHANKEMHNCIKVTLRPIVFFSRMLLLQFKASLKQIIKNECINTG